MPENKPVKILLKSYKNLVENNPLQMASSTAFFSTFSMPAIIIIMIQFLSIIFQPALVSELVNQKLRNLLGNETREQVVNTLHAFESLATNKLVTITGFIFLLFVASTLFKIIKDSLNSLWSVKQVQKQSLVSQLSSRGKFILFIIFAGFLLIAGIAGEELRGLLEHRFDIVPQVLVLYFNGMLHYLFAIVVNSIWFIIIFRYLPDIRPPLKAVLPGALFTSLLYNAGKFILHSLLTISKFTTLYGASASIMLLLLFVFYTSLILYFGASFTVEWTLQYYPKIQPVSGAAFFTKVTANRSEDEL
ncbi:MAG: YihY/virulence factor BrkB family protein [Candidatus Dadabacteria bacterium]